MASLNQCQFIGNLGKDPEIRAMQNGKKVASFSMACTESWKDKQTGERKEKTEWIPCVAFEPLAGIIERYVRKGSRIFVSGQFSTRSWDDQDGQKRYKTEINVRDMMLLDRAQGSGQGQQGAPAGAPHDYSQYGDASGDDLPF